MPTRSTRSRSGTQVTIYAILTHAYMRAVHVYVREEIRVHASALIHRLRAMRGCQYTLRAMCNSVNRHRPPFTNPHCRSAFQICADASSVDRSPDSETENRPAILARAYIDFDCPGERDYSSFARLNRVNTLDVNYNLANIRDVRL